MELYVNVDKQVATGRKPVLSLARGRLVVVSGPQEDVISILERAGIKVLPADFHHAGRAINPVCDDV